MYKNKYLKYKAKYIALKNFYQNGSSYENNMDIYKNKTIIMELYRNKDMTDTNIYAYIYDNYNYELYNNNNLSKKDELSDIQINALQYILQNKDVLKYSNDFIAKNKNIKNKNHLVLIINRISYNIPKNYEKILNKYFNKLFLKYIHILEQLLY